MITLNNRPDDYVENMTVSSLMERHNFTYPVLIVRINGELIDEAQYESAEIHEGDRVEILHPILGG